MPRVKALAWKYAGKDLSNSLKSEKLTRNISVSELCDCMGKSRNVVTARLEAPERLTLEELRKLDTIIPIDINLIERFIRSH